MPIRKPVPDPGRDWVCRFLDLLYPPRCLICRRVGTWLCAECLPQLPFIEEPICQRCGIPLPAGTLCSRCRHRPLRLREVRSVLLFQGPVRTAVHRLKYRGGRGLAEPLGQLMVHWWERHGAAIDLVAAVPLHPARLKERGYNQATLLATVLARHIGRPLLEEGTLVRVRYTRPQMELGEAERRRNVEGAFRAIDEAVRGRRILLVDDVCTTGATLEACADALQAAGAIEVRALTLARTP